MKRRSDDREARYAKTSRTSRLSAGASLIAVLAVPSGAWAAESWPVLRRGDRGPNVRVAQLLLDAHGDRLRADGIYGPGTAGKVRAFQSGRHLRADGVVGSHTWSRLAVRVRRGDRGQAVRAVQIRLRENEEYQGVLDGIFGPRTGRALRGFQRHEDLRVDGIAGPNTWRALLTHGHDVQLVGSTRPPRCRVGDLSPALGRTRAGAGQRFATLRLRNDSRRVCRLYGYVGLRLRDQADRKLETDVVRVRRSRRRTVRLQRGDQAFADLRWSAIPGPGEPAHGRCEPKPARIEVTPPNGYHQAVTRWRDGPVCEHGRIEVTPVRDTR